MTGKENNRAAAVSKPLQTSLELPEPFPETAQGPAAHAGQPPTGPAHEDLAPGRKGKKQSRARTLYTGHSPLQPENSDFSHIRLSQFQTFLCNSESEREKLSNTVEFWDGIPRYSVTRRAQNALRDEKTGSLPVYKLEFNFQREAFVAEIRPAKLMGAGPDGETISIEYYPSSREEIIEEALRKIASQQSYGFLCQFPEDASGVAFSLYELRAELASRGHTLSYAEITESLYILNFSSINIYKKGEPQKAGIASPYIPILAHATRERVNADPGTRWIVHFHPFITKGILELQYRQFNYELMMSLPNQLTRWLHKYICMKFTAASMTAPPFELHYKTIKRDSGLFKGKKERNFYEDLARALEELKGKGVLAAWRKSVLTGPRGKVLDITYYLTASAEFIKEVKAANKRQAEIATAALCKTLPPSEF
jgi:hypothetical protein